MDQKRPRDVALQRLLQDAQRLSTVEDVEHMTGDYIDGI